MRPGGFSLSMNAKVEPDYRNVYQWASGMKPDIRYVMFFERELFEICEDFEVSNCLKRDLKKFLVCSPKDC